MLLSSPLIRAVQVFGFHLATTDLRQNSDQHEAVIAELLAASRIEPNYSALSEASKQSRLLEKYQQILQTLITQRCYKRIKKPA